MKTLKTLKALKALFFPHLDQLKDPVSAFAGREILEDHQLASKRKKVFGHALLSSPFISHLEGIAAAVLALPDPVRSLSFPLVFSFCSVLFFCCDVPFWLLEDYFVLLLLLLLLVRTQHQPCYDCCCCQPCSSSREEGESKSGLGEMQMPSLRLKQRVLEAQAKFRRRNSTSVQKPPPDRSSISSASSSNAVEIKNDHTSSTGTSNSLDAACPRGGSSGTAGSASDSRDGSAIITGAPKPTQHPTPCSPPPLLPSPSEPPFTSISRESGDQSKLLTSEKYSVALSTAPLVSTPVTNPASLPFQPPPSPNEKTKAAHPEFQQPLPPASPQPLQTTYPRLPSQIIRRQSLLPQNESVLIRHLLDPGNTDTPLPKEQPVDFHSVPVGFPLLPTPATLGSGMLSRKVWVKRPGGSPTTVNVREDDMVDDVRDVVLKRYQNALGRSYDAPDITLRIIPRHNRPRSLEHSQGHHNYTHNPAERMLNPDENLVRTLDEYFPGGQSIDEALVIDVPQHPLRKTPRPSPHTYGYGSAHDSHLSIENGEYFPPMPAVPVHTQSQQMSTSMTPSQPSISVLTTGQVPPIPGSPGGSVARNPRITRPKSNRMQPSSTTIYSSGAGVTTGGTVIPLPRQQNRSRGNSDVGQPPPALPVPTPPVEDVPQKVQTPPVRVASPVAKGFKKDKKQHASPAGLLPDGAVPPINVLIVEDNVINLRLLEAFMKRLKVRWQSAINGKEAVDKWRAGGFHLVLMDIQLPVMNGLEATKEIRRLERINSIGFQEPPLPENEVLSDEDKLPNSILFKSPVIIVALTASSLQSDRHEALAAGCNDFLTKVSHSFSLYGVRYFIYILTLCCSL